MWIEILEPCWSSNIYNKSIRNINKSLFFFFLGLKKFSPRILIGHFTDKQVPPPPQSQQQLFLGCHSKTCFSTTQTLSWVIFASINHMHHRCKKSYLFYLIQLYFFSVALTYHKYFPDIFVIIAQVSIHSLKERFAELLEVASFR